jgi:hypothetical protein
MRSATFRAHRVYCHFAAVRSPLGQAASSAFASGKRMSTNAESKEAKPASQQADASVLIETKVRDHIDFAARNDRLVFLQGIARVITLNRPKALNALNMDMIKILQPFYTRVVADNADRVRQSLSHCLIGACAGSHHEGRWR